MNYVWATAEPVGDSIFLDMERVSFGPGYMNYIICPVSRASSKVDGKGVRLVVERKRSVVRLGGLSIESGLK